jgi:hypothetical protein
MPGCRGWDAGRVRFGVGRARGAGAVRGDPRGSRAGPTTTPPTMWHRHPPTAPRVGEPCRTRRGCRPRRRRRSPASSARPARRAPMALDELPQGRRRQVRPRVLEAAPGDGREDALPPGGPLQRSLAAATGHHQPDAPDGRMRCLDRWRRDQLGDGGGREVLARVREGLPAHEPRVDVEHLVELARPHGAALVGLEGQPVAVQRTQTDPQGHPTAREPVDRGHPRREVPRSVPGGGGEQGAQPDALGGHAAAPRVTHASCPQTASHVKTWSHPASSATRASSVNSRSVAYVMTAPNFIPAPYRPPPTAQHFLRCSHRDPVAAAQEVREWVGGHPAFRTLCATSGTLDRWTGSRH